MNVKKMSTEHLLEVIHEYDKRIDELSEAEADFLSACSKEVARRWGIKI